MLKRISFSSSQYVGALKLPVLRSCTIYNVRVLSSVEIEQKQKHAQQEQQEQQEPKVPHTVIDSTEWLRPADIEHATNLSYTDSSSLSATSVIVPYTAVASTEWIKPADFERARKLAELNIKVNSSDNK